MKKLIPILLIIAAAFFGWDELQQKGTSEGQLESEALRHSTTALQDAIDRQQGDVQVKGSGTVVKVLPDDNKGSRHQRFILTIASGQTLLVAHNIDLAPRVPQLKKGEVIEFFGEYEWNPRGGVIHWTHHDPGGRHVGGWLKRGDQIYE